MRLVVIEGLVMIERLTVHVGGRRAHSMKGTAALVGAALVVVAAGCCGASIAACVSGVRLAGGQPLASQEVMMMKRLRLMHVSRLRLMLQQLVLLGRCLLSLLTQASRRLAGRVRLLLTLVR